MRSRARLLREAGGADTAGTAQTVAQFRQAARALDATCRRHRHVPSRIVDVEVSRFRWYETSKTPQGSA